MYPIFLNRSRKKFTRDRVVSTITVSVSCEILEVLVPDQTDVEFGGPAAQPWPMACNPGQLPRCRAEYHRDIGTPVGDSGGDAKGETMFRLVVTVKRGSASTYPGAWTRFASIDDARAAAAGLLREERVQRVMVVRDTVSGSFVEWVER